VPALRRPLLVLLPGAAVGASAAATSLTIVLLVHVMCSVDVLSHHCKPIASVHTVVVVAIAVAVNTTMTSATITNTSIYSTSASVFEQGGNFSPLPSLRLPLLSPWSLGSLRLLGTVGIVRRW
jgi:hypothetical protein